MNVTSSVATAFLVSGTFLAVICPLTVLSNVLLLIAIYKDPFKTFRTPAAVFLVGLACIDLITGLIPEPMTMATYFRLYNNSTKSEHDKILYAAGVVLAITTNTSFFIVLAFTLTQYVAVAFPLKFSRLISVSKSAACVVGLLLYATLFETLRAAGVQKGIVEKIDLHFHSTFTLLFTITIYLLLQRAFGKQMKQRRLTLSLTTTAASEEGLERRDSSPPKSIMAQQQMIEKNFIRLNLILIVILLICSQPSAILWYIYLYSGEEIKNSPSLFVARVVADNTLYLKFLLDPFVFAWRMPKYRKALRAVLGRKG